MKKTTFAALALLCAGALSPSAAALHAQEMSPTATTDVYDFSNYSPETLLDLFYNALQDGRQYPTQAEFEAAGILESDLAFVRSHVRKAAILPRTDRLVSSTYETRNLWCNLPMDIGQDGLAGYPDGDFSSDVFSMWQYTNIFGSWNHGFFQAPGAWVDAAHKNGTDIMSGIKFFESWGSGDGTWTSYCTAKNADGTYKYVKPLINILMYFGADGINFNWEDSSYSNTDVVAFHKALWKEAAAQGLDNFHLGLYTSSSILTTANSNSLYGNSEGQTATTFLNYSGGDFSMGIGTSVKSAEAAMGNADELYAGVWIVGMNRTWTRLDADANAHKCGICLWGEHGQSRFMSYNSGSDALDTQENYQRLLERGFSGGNRNPANRPAVSDTGNNWEEEDGKLPLSTFAGLAQWIPERSAIQGNLPFYTYFNLGNGNRYNYKGKKTGESWYNMANQDRVPTYRWLVYNANTETVSTDIQPEFSHSDAYTGGSCLSLSGKATTTGTDIILFKTKLNVANGSPVARVAVKNGKTGANASSLYVIVRKEGSTAWQEFPVGDLTGATWEEKTIDLSALSQGDVIDRIGLRVKGDDSDYQLYVGKLQIDDNFKATPAAVKDLVAEVKEETQKSMSLKLTWSVDKQAADRAANNLLFNDEANIDHFEVLYKNGESGRVSEVGRTTQWATFVNDITFESTDDQPYIGVRSASTDLKTYSDVVWLPLTRADQSTLPTGEEDTYGVTQINPSAEGTSIAREQRYVTSVTTTGADQNLAYTANAPQKDGTQYVNATDHVLKVQQGQNVTVNIKCADKEDGLKWCFAGVWMDLDGSGTFNPYSIETHPESGELIFRLGTLRAATEEFQTTGISHTFTVPSDAVTGKSRLRIVFSDAWFAGMFLPTGYTAKGFSIDFGVEISGNNPQRQTEADTHDQGVADEPDGLGKSESIETVTNNGVSSASVSNGLINFSNVEKAWVYTADGRLVNYSVGVPNTSTQGYVPGTYLVRMMNNNVIRTQKVVVK